MPRIMFFLTAFLVMGTVYPSSAASQTVSVLNSEGGHGHGYMFGYAGNCYVALPRHVAGPDYFPRVNLSTPAPVVSGTGTVPRPFWEGIDLALAVASEGMRERCTASLDDLDPSRTAQRAATAHILRLLPDGSEDRVEIVVGDRGYLTFVGQVAPSDSGEIAQGTSGAFAFHEGEPIGMAITSDDTRRATFMRVEEIRMHLARFLSQTGSNPAGSSMATTEAPETASDAGLRIALVSASVPAVSPSHAPENMLTDGVFVFEPARHVAFDFRFEPDERRPVSRLRMQAPGDGTYAVPKNILIQASVEAGGAGFRTIARRQVGPDGAFDTGQIAPRLAKRLRIIVLDAWSDGPIAIERVFVW